MSPTMYASCDWCPGLDPLTHILEEVLQFPSEWIENPSQASKLWNFAVVCLTFVSESQILSETVWKQIVRCNAQLAPCQRHLPVCVAMRLVLVIRSAAIPCNMRKRLRCLYVHQRPRGCTVFFQFSIVSALPLLLLTERDCWQCATKLLCGQRSRLVLSGAGAGNQTLVVSCFLSARYAFHKFLSRMLTANGCFDCFDLFDHFL